MAAECEHTVGTYKSGRDARRCRACDAVFYGRTDSERHMDALRQSMVTALDERISKSEHYGWLGRS